jgi:hypothetical protein
MKAEYDFSKAKRGAVKSPAGKTRITIYLDDDLLEHFREAATAEGLGYQTVINRTLRAAMTDATGSAVRERVDTSALLVEVRDVLNEVRHRLPKPMNSLARSRRTALVGELAAQGQNQAEMAKRVLHVIPHSSGWAVKVEGNGRVTSVHERKQDALTAGRRLAQRDVLELVIHTRDGKVQGRDSHGGSSISSKKEVRSRNK